MSRRGRGNLASKVLCPETQAFELELARLLGLAKNKRRLFLVDRIVNMVDEPQRKSGGERRRSSSLSPTRDRGRRKPRQEWLVAVGQGQSPNSTRHLDPGSSSNSPARKKKFDVNSLSFTGLERQVGHPFAQFPPFSYFILDK